MRVFTRPAPLAYVPKEAPAKSKDLTPRGPRVLEAPAPKPLRPIPTELLERPSAQFNPEASREEVMRKLLAIRDTLPVAKKQPDMVSKIMGSKLLTEWLAKAIVGFVNGTGMPAPPTKLQLAEEQVNQKKDKQFERDVLRQNRYQLCQGNKEITTYAVIGPNGAEIQSSNLQFLENWLVEKCWTDEKTAKQFALAIRQHMAYRVLEEYSL